MHYFLLLLTCYILIWDVGIGTQYEAYEIFFLRLIFLSIQSFFLQSLDFDQLASLWSRDKALLSPFIYLYLFYPYQQSLNKNFPHFRSTLVSFFKLTLNFASKYLKVKRDLSKFKSYEHISLKFHLVYLAEWFMNILQDSKIVFSLLHWKWFKDWLSRKCL